MSPASAALPTRYGLQVGVNWTALRLAATALAARIVNLYGPARNINHAFGTRLFFVRAQDGKIYRTHFGPFSVLHEYDDAIEYVFNLDNLPRVKSQLRQSQQLGVSQTAGVSYTPLQVAQAYCFPTGCTGKGQTIAILEFGGGGRWRDLRTYFTGLGLQVPSIQTIGVAGGHNAPTGDPNADGEVMLDIEVAGAIANGAKFAMYFAPNSSLGFLQAASAAIHDATNKPNVISISWGGSETGTRSSPSGWTAAEMIALSGVFRAAAVMGISVFVAAGDDGVTDGVDPVRPHINFPASSPWATACGGTSLLHVRPPPLPPEETVWNDGDGGTGGGLSVIFPRPHYQQATNYQSQWLPMRGMPDVAGCADPATGYKVRINGMDTVVGGTSAVAPLWAGLTALLNESLGSDIGFINPLLYMTDLQGALNDVAVGNNDTTGLTGKDSATTGWDPCTGWGSPDGSKLLAKFKP